jgi:chorismate mutase
MREEIELNQIRSTLIRQEETIIFALIERAQYGINQIIYQKNGIKIPNYQGAFLNYLLSETEKIHARVRRYTAPDEHAFTDNLPQPFLTPMVYDWPILKTNININQQIMSVYIENIIPLICMAKDDGNYGSSVVLDISVLQALSKRIHYGKFVAESKYQQETKIYQELVKLKDKKLIINRLTDPDVEKMLLDRVELKASTYGQEPNTKHPVFKIQPQTVKKIYEQYIIPFTKEIEYLYLLERAELNNFI